MTRAKLDQAIQTTLRYHNRYRVWAVTHTNEALRQRYAERAREALMYCDLLRRKRDAIPASGDALAQPPQ